MRLRTCGAPAREPPLTPFAPAGDFRSPLRGSLQSTGGVRRARTSDLDNVNVALWPAEL
jgi:hypothetical protein